MNNRTLEEKSRVILEQIKAKIASNGVGARRSTDNLILALENAPVKLNIQISSTPAVELVGNEHAVRLGNMIHAEALAEFNAAFHTSIDTKPTTANVSLKMSKFKEMLQKVPLPTNPLEVYANITELEPVIQKPPINNWVFSDMYNMVTIQTNPLFVSMFNLPEGSKNTKVAEIRVLKDQLKFKTKEHLKRIDLREDWLFTSHDFKAEEKAKRSAYKEKFFSKRTKKKVVKLNPLLAKLIAK